MAKISLYTDREVIAAGLVRAILLNYEVERGGLDGLLKGGPAGQLVSPVDAVILDAPIAPVNLIPALQAVYPGIPIIAWVRATESEPSLNALELGAVGVLQDNSSNQDILDCVECALRGSIWAPSSVAQALLSRRRCKLTPREGQLVKLVSQGLCNKEIAYALSISVGTVKVYISRLFDKLAVSDRYELGLLALRQMGTVQGLTPSPGSAKPAPPSGDECPDSVYIRRTLTA